MFCSSSFFFFSETTYVFSILLFLLESVVHDINPCGRNMNLLHRQPTVVSLIAVKHISFVICFLHSILENMSEKDFYLSLIFVKKNIKIKNQSWDGH
jgi:hypothetical protein